VDELAQHRTDEYVRKIEKNLGLVVSALQVEVAALRTQVSAYQTTLKQSTAMVQDVCSTMRLTVQAGVSRQQSTNSSVLARLDENTRAFAQMQESQQEILLLLKQQNQQQQQHQNYLLSMATRQSAEEEGVGGADGGGNVARLPTEAKQKEGEIDDDVVDVGVFSHATAHARRGEELGYNAVQMLRPSPRLPSIKGFPKDWPAFLAEWNNNDLESFINSIKSDWKDDTLVQRFTKRHRGIKELRKFMINHHYHDEAEAAMELENIRGSIKKSLSTHIMQLFLSNGDIKRRVRLIKSKQHRANNSDTDSLLGDD
jgi:hypothetical protein